jgi:epoxyqueuosine reductase
LSKSPIKRTGRDRFVRNVLVAIGNSGETALADAAERLIGDPSPVVRGAAIWALGRLDPARLKRYAELGDAESDPAVREEWQAALAA